MNTRQKLKWGQLLGVLVVSLTAGVLVYLYIVTFFPKIMEAFYRLPWDWQTLLILLAAGLPVLLIRLLMDVALKRISSN